MLQGSVSHELTVYLSVFDILSKGCKSDNFQQHNSLKRSFIDIRGLHSNCVECESFLESNSPDILAVCQTNLDDSIDSGDFSMRVYHPLIRKDSTTHMHGLSVMCRKDFLLHEIYP